MDEHVKRTKDKLRVYGSYSRDIHKVWLQLERINGAMFWHQDWPEQAAKELGIKGADNKHPPGQQLCVQKTALEAQLEQLRTARSALGLDDWLDSLSQDDRQIIRLVYEDEMTQQEVAPRVNLTRSGVKHRINAICKTRPAGR